METSSNDVVEMKNIDKNHTVDSAPSVRYLRKRFIVGFLVWFGFFLIFVKQFTNSLSFVLLYVRPARERNDRLEENEEIDWDEYHLLNQLSLAFYCGYVLTSIPAGYLSYRFHVSRLFFLSVVASCFINICIPFLIYSKGALFALRFFQGLSEGFILPSFIGIWKNWAPSNEISILVPISYSGLFFGLLTGSELAFAFRNHWEYPYYIIGGLSALWIPLWLWLVYDSPSQHPTIKEEELSLFTSLESKPIGDIPWKRFFTSMPVWAFFIGTFSMIQIFITGLYDERISMEYHRQVELSDKRVNEDLVNYVTFIILFSLATVIASYMSNRRKVSKTWIRKGTICLGIILGVITFGLHKLVAQISFLNPFGVAYSVAVVAILVNPLDIAPQFASILVGVSNTLATMLAIILPLMIQLILYRDNFHPFVARVIYSISSVILGCIFYAIFASGEKQPWAK